MVGARLVPLFLHEGGLPLTQFQFWIVIQKTLKLSGLSYIMAPTHFTLEWPQWILMSGLALKSFNL